MNATPDRRLTRRQLVIGGAGAAVGLAALGTGGFVWASDPRSIVMSLVRHVLPGVSFEDASFRRFADDFLEQWDGPDPGFTRTLSLKLASAVNSVFGTDAVVVLGPQDYSDDFTRGALTLMLLNSNFFEVDDPRAVEIVYRRRLPGTPCNSTPWADLRPPSRAAGSFRSSRCSP